jgi:hypothetical protein
MRGTVPPSGIMWTCFGCLPQLPPPDAKRVVLAINPSLSDGGRGDKECLDKLHIGGIRLCCACRSVVRASIDWVFTPIYAEMVEQRENGVTGSPGASVAIA